jgi:hypothetical protein
VTRSSRRPVPQVLSAPHRTLVPPLAVALVALCRFQALLSQAHRPLSRRRRRPSPAHVHRPVSHLRVRLSAQALPLSVALALQAHPVSALAQAARHVIRHSLQARRLALSRRVRVPLVRAVAVHPVHHLSVVLALPVIQHSLLLAPLAARPVAPHLHLQARASKSYRASISIQIANKMDGLLLLWDLDRVSQIE